MTPSLPPQISAVGVKKAEPIARRVGDAGCGPYRGVTPVVDILQHHTDAVGKADLGLPPKLTADFPDIGPGAIRFARPFRDLYAWRRSKLPHQVVDADRLTTAHIVNFADFVTLRDGDQGIDHIGDEGEIPGLFAITDNCQRFLGQQLSEENAEYRAVGSTGPSPDRKSVV